MANENLIVPRFYVHTVQNESKSKAAGRPIFDEMELCELRFAANKQTVGAFPAHEVFRTDKNMQTGELTPMTYAIAYREQYLKFKNNEAQDMSGTPLSELPFLTQSKRLELKALNIHTAEALAALDGQPLKQLGMGGRELKTQARAYLDNASGSVDVVKLAARIAALEAENAALKSSAEPESDGDEVTVSPFQEWDGDDIKNWIEANAGARPKGNPSHATLVKKADEVNAELAEKAKAEQAV
jgi:hypothetical protein